MRPGIRLIWMGLLLSGFLSCQKEMSLGGIPQKDHNLVLHFKPVVQYDSVELEFGQPYTNFFNETFRVENFKFYVHGIQLINTDSGKIFTISADKYFLVDCADSAKSRIPIAVLPYQYNRIAFILGVDSARNVSGAQTGALEGGQMATKKAPARKKAAAKKAPAKKSTAKKSAAKKTTKKATAKKSE